MEQENYYNLYILLGLLFAFVVCLCMLDYVLTKIEKIQQFNRFDQSNIKGSELL